MPSFPFSESSNLLSIRLDHHFSQKDSAFLRGSMNLARNENSQFGALIGFSRGRGPGN